MTASTRHFHRYASKANVEVNCLTRATARAFGVGEQSEAGDGNHDAGSVSGPLDVVEKKIEESVQREEEGSWSEWRCGGSLA